MTLDIKKDKSYKSEYVKVWVEGSASTDNHFYYNLVLHNPSTTGVNIPASFNDVRATPLLTNPEDWHVAVTRFSIPTHSIPLFFLSPDSTLYPFIMSYNGTDYKKYVQAIDAEHTRFSEYWQFIDRMNATLLDLFNTVKTANPGAPPTQAPFIIFNPSTQLSEMIFTQEYDPDFVSPTIELWTNFNLFYKFFVGYRETNTGDQTAEKFIKFTVTNVGNNVGFFQDPLNPPPICGTGCTGPVYYNMVTETVNIGLLNETIGLVFTSNNLPTRGEAIPLNVQSNQTTTDASRKILTDFIIPISGTSPSPRESITYQYNAQIYRWIDLLGTNPLYNLNIDAWYENTNQELSPIVLLPGSTWSMKLLFKKGLVTT